MSPTIANVISTGGSALEKYQNLRTSTILEGVEVWYSILNGAMMLDMITAFTVPDKSSAVVP